MSISEDIRALAREGLATAEIARRLGIRYQHAYNVLKAGEALPTPSNRVSEAGRPPSQEKRGLMPESAESYAKAVWSSFGPPVFTGEKDVRPPEG